MIAEQVYERLSDGEHLVVKGEGGTGKSTVCKRVACRWNDDPDRGPVLYRGSATGTSFDTPGTLIDVIRSTEDDLLVVVEDVPSGDATAIFEVLAECKDASDVAFLLDAREGAWNTMTEVDGHASLERQRQQLGIVDMPALDKQECHRAIQHYETLTGEEVGRSGGQLYEEVCEADLGSPLVLAYQLTGPAIDTERPVSALHADVRRAYNAVEERADDKEFPQTVATMVNVLNAAGLPVEAAFVHALADEPADHRLIERMLDFLEGTMLEQSEDDFRLPHQLWSTLYLQHMLDMAGERLARDRFERCVSALFRLFDESSRRERVLGWVRDPTESFTAITENPEETASHFVGKITDIGRKQPPLGELYGPSDTWNVPFPDQCSVSAKIQWFVRCGGIHHDRGAFEATQMALERAGQLIDTTQNELPANNNYRSCVCHNLGAVASARGELDTAEEHYEQSLALKQEIGDRHGEANTLHNLGNVAIKRGELDTAEEYFEKSLALNQEIGDRHGEADVLVNIGEIARRSGDFETAKDHYNESIDLYRESGDRQGEAESLGNLGIVYLMRGELDTAEEYYKKSLALKQEIGNRYGEARSLGSLGNVAFKRGELDTAEEYYERSLALKQEIGDCQGESGSLSNLGNVAIKRRDLDTAEEYYERSLALIREIGDRHSEAEVLINLGEIARKRGELDTAEEHYNESLGLSRESGHFSAEAKCLANLKRLAQIRDDFAFVEECLEASLTLFQEKERNGAALNSFDELITLCVDRGAKKKAIEWCDEAIELADRTGHPTERERFQARRSELDAMDE